MLGIVNELATAIHMAATPHARDQYGQIWIPGRSLLPGSPLSGMRLFKSERESTAQEGCRKLREKGMEMFDVPQSIVAGNGS